MLLGEGGKVGVCTCSINGCEWK